MTRGAKAAGTIAHTRAPGQDHPSKLLRLHVGTRRRSRSRGGSRASSTRLRVWLAESRRPVPLASREAARGHDARRRADVPRPLGVDDRRRRRPEHDDAQQLRAEHGLRHGARAREAAARDPRGEHGRRQEAVAPVLPAPATARPSSPRRRSATRRSHASCGRAPEDLEELSWAGTHGAVASGMQSVAFTPASAIAAIFAATGQDLGMVGTSSMAHGTGRRVDGGFHCSIRFAGPRGRYGRRRDDASFRARLARRDRLLRPGQGLPLRADRRRGRACAGDLGVGRDGDRRLGELLPRASRARRRPLSTRRASSPRRPGPIPRRCRLSSRYRHRNVPHSRRHSRADRADARRQGRARAHALARRRVVRESRRRRRRDELAPVRARTPHRPRPASRARAAGTGANTRTPSSGTARLS